MAAYMKRVRKCPDVKVLIDTSCDSHHVVTEPRRIADTFANHYKSVFIPRLHCCESSRAIPPPSLTTFPLQSPESVHALISRGSPKTACGPDGIPPLVVKRLCPVLAAPLAKVFNHSFTTEELSTSWTLSNVTPVFKNKGDALYPVSYRPIGVINSMGAIIEKIVSSTLMAHLESNEFLNAEQHGNRFGLSTQTNLLVALDQALRNKDMGLSVSIVYFNKAFDVVSHSHLLYKLRRCGVGGLALSWLSGQKQRVKVMDTFSEWYDVTSSVIQGSVVGPLLFVLYMSDLCVGLSSSAYQFVDNLKIIRAIRDGSDCELLQQDLLVIQRWYERWHMGLNARE
eukprot:GHVN01064884.1.p1 GENE.GHVN01064884.1~~GHVN01064884.1.p1  ORF type:complete len:340 (-),score=25.25 GHVN01064884.1:886-1905(-)